MLQAISPIDGRYASKTRELSDYFSEFALIKYRVYVEVEYFQALCEIPLPQLSEFPEAGFSALSRIVNSFQAEDAERVKTIERTTNHDVKAVEYFLKEKMEEAGLGAFKEFVHFGLTSQDINNTAVPLSIKHALENVYLPLLNQVIDQLSQYQHAWQEVPMLARTHGQPASPTLLGKEIAVFKTRLSLQKEQLLQVPHTGKFGGATGNMNAHYVSYPSIDWHGFATDFLEMKLGLRRSFPTTQIEHYDNLAALFHAMSRINTILLDLCRDVWTYISMEYFLQKTVAGEIGSSAMPHKVNPIDFENAEGNLGVANALFEHLAAKLPVSRLQRDLTDSTVLRNVGVPFAHTVIAFHSILKGLSKLQLNGSRIHTDLEAHWSVVAEAIQNILRREGYPNPYEKLKELTRGKEGIDESLIRQFILNLDIEEALKEELLKISPLNYVGKS